MKTLEVLGTRLKELRTERRIYQREMGDLLKVTLRHYQKIEKGEVNIPTLSLCTLADYFGVTTDYLLGRSEARQGTEKSS